MLATSSRAPPTYRSEAGSIHTAPSFTAPSFTSTRPPSYSQHFTDELISPPVRFNTRHNRRSNGNSFISEMLQILTSPEPLTLTIDNNLVYPPPPSTALYHLPRHLAWSGNEISLSRNCPGSANRPRSGTLASARDLCLYTMKRTPFSYEISLLPRREGLKQAVMQGKRSLLGNMSWEIESRGDRLLRYSKGKWKLVDTDRVVAVERTLSTNAGQKSTPTEEGGDYYYKDPIREEIEIQGDDVELWLKDLIVAAWCCRIWAESHYKVSFTGGFGTGMKRKSLNPYRKNSTVFSTSRMF